MTTLRNLLLSQTYSGYTDVSNDATTARERLDTLLDSDEKHHSITLNAYIIFLEANTNGLSEQFKADWDRASTAVKCTKTFDGGAGTALILFRLAA